MIGESTVTRLRIGQIARKASVAADTVRFYERVGLLPTPSRSPAGYRLYPPTAASRLQFIQRAKGVGFTLDEIRTLLTLGADPRARSVDVRRQTEGKIAEVETKIRDLQLLRRRLKTLVASCDGRGAVRDCTILASLAGSEGDVPCPNDTAPGTARRRSADRRSPQ